MALKMMKPEVLVETPVQTIIQQKVMVEEKKLTETEALTAEYVQLYRQYVEKDVKKLVARMEVLRKQLQSIANEEVAPDKPAIFTSPEGEVVFSERGTVTEIKNPQELIDHLALKFNEDVAYSVVDIALTPLRKILSEMELATFIDKTWGSRTLKMVKPV